MMQFHEHPHTHEPAMNRRTALRIGGLGIGGILLAACSPTRSVSTTSAAESVSTSVASDALASTTTLAAGGSKDVATTIAELTTLPGFDEFAGTVKVIASGDYWLIESNGMPAHNMMVGIKSWQQQVPIPMSYAGSNAWQIPQNPQLADNPISGKTQLYRGAIALAANGIPIFNALNNRGEDAFLVGELDQWGGHCGKADDYHYHVAPLHLSSIVGKAKPIAYALDGFAIYGGTEPDGSAMTALDAYNGHTGTDGVYHYHGTTTYPYINGGLRGVIRGVVGDQVDPQPTTKPIREAGAPLQGAVITDFSSPKSNQYSLQYTLDGKTGLVEYAVSSSKIAFTFTSPAGIVTTETYSR